MKKSLGLRCHFLFAAVALLLCISFCYCEEEYDYGPIPNIIWNKNDAKTQGLALLPFHKEIEAPTEYTTYRFLGTFKAVINHAKVLNGPVSKLVFGGDTSDPITFYIDFCYSSDPEGAVNIPLRLRFRIDEKKVYVYTFKDGVWGNEQSGPDHHTHHITVHSFDIRVQVVPNNKIRIWTDGIHSGYFDLPVPDYFWQVNHLHVHGDIVNLELVDYGGTYMSPLDNIPVAVYMAMGMLQRFEMSVIGNTEERIEFSFMNSEQRVLLLVSVRFDEGVIVRNSQIVNTNGTWYTEERDGAMPVEKFRVFDFTMRTFKRYFFIYFNGKFFARYTKKINYDETIEFFRITGNCEVMSASIFPDPMSRVYNVGKFY